MTDEGAFEEKLEELKATENGPTRVALAEELVGLAGDDLARAFAARKELVEAATFANRPEVSLVAFAWLLARSDKEPERFPEIGLLWSYKWVANCLPSFPHISRAQMDETLADMERRFVRCGLSLRPVHKLRCTSEILMGDAKRAREHYVPWVDARRDSMSDCPACDQDAQVEFLCLEERDEEALKSAQPIIEGNLECQDVPHRTLGRVLLSLVRLGRWEDAARYHRRGVRLIGGGGRWNIPRGRPSGARRWVGVSADHLAFLALSKNVEAAQRWVDQRLPWALESTEIMQKLRFLLAVQLHVRLGGSCALEDLDEQVRELASRFDRRNGNDHFTKQIEKNDSLGSIARSLPL